MRLLVLVCVGIVPMTLIADDWPQWFGPKGDGIWRETGIIDSFPKEGLKPKWQVKLGAGYSGPAVAQGRVYVLDRQTTESGDKPSAKLSTIPGTERILCLDEKTGKEIWKHEYPCKYEKVSYGFGPRTTPTVVGDRVYTLGTMGDLFCLESATGKVIWHKNFRKDYMAPTPIWGWSSHPMIDGDKLYCLVGGEKRAVMCFDRHTGKEIWNALTTEEIGYVPLIIIEAGGKRQLLVWHTESINSLDLNTGEKYWSQKYPIDVESQRPSAPISVPRVEGNTLFITSFYHGPIALKLDEKEAKASILWRPKTDSVQKVTGLCSLMSSPSVYQGHIYGISRFGELSCTELATGKQLWETLDIQKGKKQNFGTTFLVRNEDKHFLFSDNGDLILAQLSPKGYQEISRARAIQPTQPNSGRDVVWSHPAFANKHLFVRNDREMVCISLAK